MPQEDESYRTVSFFCICRKRLYTMITNIFAYEGEFECESCGANIHAATPLSQKSSLWLLDGRGLYHVSRVDVVNFPALATLCVSHNKMDGLARPIQDGAKVLSGFRQIK